MPFRGLSSSISNYQKSRYAAASPFSPAHHLTLTNPAPMWHRGGNLLGAIAVADTVRPEAKRAIDAHSGMGVRTILLTRDTLPVAQAV